MIHRQHDRPGDVMLEHGQAFDALRPEALVTRSGYAFQVRPAEPADEKDLAYFFTQVEKVDLRFRFLTAINKVGSSQLKAMIIVDHERTENFLAIQGSSGHILATAMMAVDDTRMNAEVAIAIRADFKNRGISWTLLEHVARAAAARGIRTLEAIESRDNHQAIAIEREMGWEASSVQGDPTLILLRKTLGASAAATSVSN